jgi:RNA polymerase sigma factor (sigma-70 family)
MSHEEIGSVSHWIAALKEGQPEAASALWQRYYERVVAVARRRLAGDSRQAVEDAEDVALSAMNSLCAGAARGQFNRLGDRVDLWRLMVAITVKKTLSRQQRLGRLKRGGAPVQPEQTPETGSEQGCLPSAEGLALARSAEPTPESAAIIEEQFQELLGALDDPVLREIALWRMDGLSNAEIAGKLGCATRTVERKLERIRMIWQEIGAAADH